MFYNLEGTQAFVAALLHQLCYKAELRKREEPLHPGNVLSVKPANTDQIPATSSGREFGRFLPFESESKNDRFTENDKVYFHLFFFYKKSQAPPLELCRIISNQKLSATSNNNSVSFWSPAPRG